MTYTLGEVEHETEKAILAYIKFEEQGKTQITEEQLWIPKVRY